ncbi:putative baseplate assembly protein [Massilia sp. CF038]|uniref:putative baseplate assembly protein n=1 Tax=Massilia sp. CF038 TaxID=1881045 RepID=UPI00091DBA3F|nr:putative baseplate assembly protein [Massilia sp. CF038]SHG51769.1 putative baseplate assembly protein [Massilia sp. CF038]
MNDLPCDCCEGVHASTPRATFNRAGRAALRYRAGTYASFFDSMRARLSSAHFFEGVRDKLGDAEPLNLDGLKTRAPEDFSIALMDAWAVTADVLTFYQERIANEGYLRCATERRSVLELARLAGYNLRPGVAASVYLAYALEKDAEPVDIPKGSRANSVPGPGEQMEAFETSEPLQARVEWNELLPRMSRPLNLTPVNAAFIERLRFKGTALNLAVNDVMLLTFGRRDGQQVMRRVVAIKTDSAVGETEVQLQLAMDVLTILAAWADVAGRYADIEWRCLEKNKPEINAVVSALLALQQALEEVQFSQNMEKVTEANKKVALAAKELLKGNDKEELAWIRDYFLEAVRFLTGGRISDREAREMFSASFEFAGANFSMLSQGLVANLVPSLSKARSRQPANSQRLGRKVGVSYSLKSDLKTRLLTQFQPAAGRSLYQAWRNVPLSKASVVDVFVMRQQAPLFGHNAQKRTKINDTTKEVDVVGDWPVITGAASTNGGLFMHEEANAVHLDTAYPKILPNSWLIVQTVKTRLTNAAIQFFLAGEPSTTITRAEYGMTGKTTRVPLLIPRNSGLGTWITAVAPPSTGATDDFEAIRRTVVYAQAEKLELAELPITDDVCGERVELSALYDGLEAGRWVIVTGERSDLKDDNGDAVNGVVASELAMVGAVTQDVKRVLVAAAAIPKPGVALGAGNGAVFALTPGNNEHDSVSVNTGSSDGDHDDDTTEFGALPGDTVHTFLEFASPLAYKFKRATVKIRANVVRATHGETRREVLGSGDAAKALQSFTLKQAPLTYTSAATVSGVASSLSVRVNEIEWHETDSLAGLGAQERKFVTHTNDEGKTSIIFGNGIAGARLPGGQENVRAVYRSGIGRPGNVKAEQISLLSTRPLGAKSVINPLRASGGANAETRDQTRKNVPLALMALDRLVSVQDHADFARTFGGVGKAVAAERSDGRREVVHLTIAGVDDQPIDDNSDLLRNLRAALRLNGDPALPIRLQVRERLALVVSAKVRILPDYAWEAVEAQLRVKMLDAFSFDALELGSDLFASHAIAVLQGVRGVDYVDLDVFDVISETALLDSFKLEQADALGLKRRIPISPGSSEGGILLPAQIAYLSPEVADTLILQEIPA